MSDAAPNDIADHIRGRIETAEKLHAVLTQRWNSVANLRLVAAIPLLGFGFWWLRTGESIWLVAAFVALAIFAFAVIRHNQIGSMRSASGHRVDYRREQLARIERNWAALPANRPANLPADHPYANDLDLVGTGSLLHLVDTTETAIGFRTLLGWLGQSSGVEEALRRQHGAQTLSTDEEWREDLAVAGSLRDGSEADAVDTEAIVAFGKRSISIRHILAVIGAAAMVVGVILVAAGVLNGTILLLPLVLNIAVSFTAPMQADLGRSMRGLRQLRRVMPVLERSVGEDPILVDLRDQLHPNGQRASDALRSLDRRLAAVIPKGSILWFPLQLAVNWDVLVDGMVIQSTARIGPHLDHWIAAVGEFEALAALANFAALNPEFHWPRLDRTETKITLSQAGHPLIRKERRVCNDVTVGPEGSVMIVTGSNMAGKSTLLRTVGLNAVLALAGGPVCADRMVMGEFAVWSSVRVQDSLAQGVSLFMAELVRLRQVVDAARAAPVLYLLDEILHGTNTSERRIAARTVIWHLLRTHGVGMVSTHDLELIDVELEPHTVIVHLVDQIRQTPEGPEMFFDYKVRPGMAPSSNALRLLALVGLGPEAEAGE
jgi:hypothetical protein